MAVASPRAGLSRPSSSRLRRAAAWSFAAVGLVAMATAGAQPAGGGTDPYAPGTLTVIPPQPAAADTVSGPFVLREITTIPELDYQPNLVPKTKTAGEVAKAVTIRRPVWSLEFAFKPLRMVTVDIPRADGRFQRQNVWYLVYRVRNTGQHLAPKVLPDRTVETEPAPSLSVRFQPRIVLEGVVRTGTETRTSSYLDRIVPVALPAITDRERPPMPLLNSVEMADVEIGPPGGQQPSERWGVAMWEDIDPRIVYMKLLVGGLSNGYQLSFGQDGTPQYAYKTLQLNFWRPGDVLVESEDHVIYGVRTVDDKAEQSEILKLYGLEQPLDYRWTYR